MDKQPNSSNRQGLENEQPLPQGSPENIISFDTHVESLTLEHQPTGEFIKEKADIDRLHDEDFRLRIHEIEEGKPHVISTPVIQHHRLSVSEYDPVVHPDAKPGRLHLSVRYDDERSQLIIHMINAEGIIRPEQTYAPEMCLTFSLIGNTNVPFDNEKHQRFIVENAPITWKEPVRFSIIYKKVIEAKLHIIFRNSTDPSMPHDREIFVPLNDLNNQSQEINDWFNLQYVKSK